MVEHIMAVDDDPDVLGTLYRVLKHDGYNVTPIGSGREALACLEEKQPDLLILDIMMPEMDGIEVCLRVRKNPAHAALPILFLTAKSETKDIVVGLDAGADDYVVKPFEITELRARVQALLRRGKRGQEPSRVLRIGNLMLDSDMYQATVLDQEIQLTATEHRLLRYFMENANQVLPLSRLLQAVWEYPEDTGDPDLVRAHVRNLRKKIEKDPARRYISTVHGLGYKITN